MKPMLCRPIEFEQALALSGAMNPEDYIIEKKYDGVRAYIIDEF